MIGARPPEFSVIEDVSRLVSSADSGELLTVKELCAIRRTLVAARDLFEKLQKLASEQLGERYFSNFVRVFLCGLCHFFLFSISRS